MRVLAAANTGAVNPERMESATIMIVVLRFLLDVPSDELGRKWDGPPRV